MAADLDQEVVDKVKEMVSEQLGKAIDEIDIEAKLIEDLDADSLDLVELVMAMEDEFALDISDEAAEKIQTVKDAVNFILENRK